MHKGIKEVSGGGYEHKGVQYYPSRQKYRFSDYHFNIIDIGELKPELMEVYRQADCRVLCTPGKPYALQSILAAQKLMADCDAHVLIHSTPESTREEFRRIASNPNRKVFFPGYSPDLFDGNANASIWSQMMSEYVVAEPDTSDKQNKKKRMRLFE
jgi:hypothetical protein